MFIYYILKKVEKDMLVSKFLFEGNLFWENLNSYFFF